MDMSLSKLCEIVNDREAWHAGVHGVAKTGHNLMTKHEKQNAYSFEVKQSCQP